MSETKIENPFTSNGDQYAAKTGTEAFLASATLLKMSLYTSLAQ